MEPTGDKRIDLFSSIRFNLQLAAMYPLNLNSVLPRNLQLFGGAIEWMFEIFLYFVTMHIVILYMCTFYLNLKSGNLELLVTCLLHTTIYMWTMFMKLYFRRLRPHLLAKLMSSMNSEYRTRSEIGLSFVTMDECITMSNKWFKRYFFCCFSGSVLWLFQPIVHGNRSLPLSCWYPIDYKAPVIYEFIYFLQSVAQLQVSAAFCASSGLHMVLAILISGQYDILFCSLKNILSTVGIRMRLSKNDLRELTNLQEFKYSVINEYYCAKEIQCSFSSLVMYIATYGNQQYELQNFRQNFLIAFQMSLAHQKFLRECLSKMNQFYSPIWFVKTGQVILLMCLVAFASVKSTSTNTSIMQVISLGQYLLLVALEFLVICHFGEIISYNSQRGDEAILRSPWYMYMGEMKTEIITFLINSYRPFRLTAGGLYALNLNCFCSVMKTAFSFLTFLQTIDENN